MPRKSKPPSGPAEASLAPLNIGFRIDPETRRLLGERVTMLNTSPHEWARHCLVTILHEEEDRSGWQSAVTALHHEINDLRNDLALATQALLVAAGNVPEKQAREWIGRNLKPR